jgi:hypothetical protein
MMNVVMLSAVTLNVVMLSVVAPIFSPFSLPMPKADSSPRLCDNEVTVLPQC